MKIFLLLLIITSFLSCGNYCNDYLAPLEFNGIIISKYRDEYSYNLKKLKITQENKIIIVVIEDKDKSFWNFVEEGYGISKKANSTEIIIIRNKEEYTFNLCK